MFTSSCLFYCEMCHGLKLPVYCYTRAQITTVKFLMNSVNTPASCLYDIFLKISFPSPLTAAFYTALLTVLCEAVFGDLNN